jgi:hypothetical protein
MDRRTFIQILLCGGIAVELAAFEQLLHPAILEAVPPLNWLDERFSPDPEYEKKIQERYHINIQGDRTSNNLVSLEILLDYTAKTMDYFWPQLNNVDCIYIKHKITDEFTWDPINNTISVEFPFPYFQSEILVHELAHAHNTYLPEATQFFDSWKDTIIPDFYSIVKEKGMHLSQYVPKEEVASVVQDIYWMKLHLYKGGSPVDLTTKTVPQTFFVIRDLVGKEKMQEKISLLGDYQFISPNEKNLGDFFISL